MDNINMVLEKITNNLFNNKELFLKYFNSLDYCNKDYDSLLHLIIKGDGTYSQKIQAITTLLKNNINPNIKDKQGNTFIHLAVMYEEDINFIIDILLLAIQHDFNINSINNQEYTLLHEAIIHADKDKFDDILKLINWIKKRNFNFNIKNQYGQSLNEFIINSKKISKKQKTQLKEIINSERGNQYMNKDNNIHSKGQNFNINKYGCILNDKNYLGHPAIGRDKEIYDIIISLAQTNKLPLLVGTPGVGKTSIIDEIAYMIKYNMVPDFLKYKKIYEVSPFNIIAGTSFRGDMEKNMLEIINYCIENNTILFIDEFHLIYGTGSTRDSQTDIASILKNYIDRYNLMVIGTITDIEYEKYMSNDPLKRRFDIIKVNEPINDILYNIIINKMEQFSNSKNISISNEIINNKNIIIDILLDLTKEKNRVYNDKVSNPDLVVSIIDKSFAYSLVDNSNTLELKHLISSIKSCERIYPSSKESAISKLNNLSNSKKLVRTKNPIINFNDWKNNL